MTDANDGDASLALAFSLYSNPGAYALLLGAGVSAPTVKTAWGVLVDLCDQLAVLEGDDSGDDASSWYEAKYGSPPAYGALLQRLASTGEERQRLLASYFEPNAAERDEGLKVPTPAHHAIARLVADGWVRIIVTLNFDRLIETALRDAGVEPTVVATPADAEGLAPLHTLKACVIHLHGDYLTPAAMLNTEAELSRYPKQTRILMESILREYGLVIAGWSATYDTKLRSMVSAKYPDRYSLTWIEPGTQSTLARNLLVRKRGRLIPEYADEALGKLADAISALASRRARHPLTVPVAIETAKRELSGRHVAINLHDRLASAFTYLHQLPDLNLANYDEQANYPDMVGRIEEAVRLPAALIATLAYWGDPSTDDWWIHELERFTLRLDRAGLVSFLDIRSVAGTWLAYAAGVGATAGRRHGLLRRLFDATAPEPLGRSGRVHLYCRLNPVQAFATEELTIGFYARVGPLLEDALSLGPTPLEEAWQQFEVLRLANLAMSNSSFGPLRAEYIPKQEAAELIEKQFIESGQNPSLQQQRFEASRESGRAFGKLMRLTDPRGLHLLSAEVELDEYRSPTAERLLAEVSAQGETHTLVASGTLPNRLLSITALQAISHQIGAVGKDCAWSRGNGHGMVEIPSGVWLDTGQSAAELGNSAP